ncbi:MAG TPA: ureidoglycolate lyase [Candidatus Competibacteraceae bacterium]|nr:ureidoglycolate lyase [Candidatus Competibacteraceae bacterium]
MATIHLPVQSLTREAFAPFGDVIETAGAHHFGINEGAIECFHDLAKVDVGVKEDGRTLISIARCNRATTLPLQIKLIERHPLGSQAFIPLSDTPLVVVVARPGETVESQRLHAFVSNGRQGINYHRGVWHIPLIALEEGQAFIIVDRGGPGPNCDEFRFDDEIILSR